MPQRWSRNGHAVDEVKGEQNIGAQRVFLSAQQRTRAEFSGSSSNTAAACQRNSRNLDDTWRRRETGACCHRPGAPLTDPSPVCAITNRLLNPPLYLEKRDLPMATYPWAGRASVRTSAHRSSLCVLQRCRFFFGWVGWGAGKYPCACTCAGNDQAP